MHFMHHCECETHDKRVRHTKYRSSGRRYQYYTWKVPRLRHKKEMNWKLIYIHSFDAVWYLREKSYKLCCSHRPRLYFFNTHNKVFPSLGFTVNIQSKYISFISPFHIPFSFKNTRRDCILCTGSAPSQKISVERAVHAKFSAHIEDINILFDGDCLFHPWIPLRRLQSGQIIKQDTRWHVRCCAATVMVIKRLFIFLSFFFATSDVLEMSIGGGWGVCAAAADAF